MKNALKQCRRVLKPMRWVWMHKRKSAGYFTALLIFAYTIVFVGVSCAKSPTDQAMAYPWVDGETRQIAYLEREGGDPDGGRVVLVHGSPADAGSWMRLLEQADRIESAQLIAIDRHGYGNSTGGDELTLAGHAAAIEPLLAETNSRRPIIVGHSYGGPVALRTAIEYPERVGGLVLVAGACDAYMKDAQWFRRLIDAVRIVVPEDWERANRELLALTDENQAMEPMLDRVTCPVVIVHGTWDGVCPHDSTVAYLQGRLVNAASVRVVSIKRARHNLQLTHVDKVIEAINSIESAE
ncbi:MAG: alpha/beta hydrolase [Planctomycetota bacterium]